MNAPSADLVVHFARRLVLPFDSNAKIDDDSAPAVADDDIVRVEIAVRDSVSMNVVDS